jgi:hypothetical protein
VIPVDYLFQLHIEQLALRLIRLSLWAHIFPQVMWRIEALSAIIIAPLFNLCC